MPSNSLTIGAKEMKLSRLNLTAILLPLFCSLVVGQVIDDESNWYKEIGKYDDYYSRFDFRRYSKQDVINAKDRYLRIQKAGAEGEWEGEYVTNTETGEALVTWNASHGFVYTYIYHTLASLDSGSAVDEREFVRFNTSKNSRWNLLTERLAKVRIGKKHYLVPVSSLREFGLWVGGQEISDDGFMWNYLFKKDEMEISAEGTPIFPKQFQQFITKPIIAKIIKVGPRKLEMAFDETTKEVHRVVTISAGYRSGVKLKMDFYVPELGEWIEITNTTARTAAGRLRRDLEEDGRDRCYDSVKGQGNNIPCKAIRRGFQVETKMKDL